MLRCIARISVVWVCVCGWLVATGAPGIWLDVPFISQEKEGCGAASIAMVMQYWLHQQGQPLRDSADAAKIQQTLYSREDGGIRASALEKYFQQQGFRTFAFQGEMADLKEHLGKGRPLIVVLKTGINKAPLHYVVVTGLDWEHRVVLVNDPAQRKLLKQEQSNFEQEWRAAGKWTLLALPQPDAR